MDDKGLTPAMEDYLETIFLLVGEKKVARVKDIAEARGVKPGSVTPAMKRLSALGLIRYEQREFIDLTPKGRTLARRTLARHALLRRFFEDVLRLGSEEAEANACAMEHYLSDQGVDRFTRFFEFIQRCPRGRDDFLDRFHACPVANPELPACEHRCVDGGCAQSPIHEGPVAMALHLDDLNPGQRGIVSRVDADGEARKDLLDLGLLPNTEVDVLGHTHPAGSLRLMVNGQEIILGGEAAHHVVVRPAEVP